MKDLDRFNHNFQIHKQVQCFFSRCKSNQGWKKQVYTCQKLRL